MTLAQFQWKGTKTNSALRALEDHAVYSWSIHRVCNNLPDVNLDVIKKACMSSMKYAVQTNQRYEKKKSRT
jgi:hypothetical protein